MGSGFGIIGAAADWIVQSTGDGIFALFGAPVAHEDHPQRAVHAALAAHNDLRRRGEGLWMHGGRRSCEGVPAQFAANAYTRDFSTLAAE
jgi:class 3 adenylate cyclase